MPMDPVSVAAAVSEGYSPICATCEHFWNARDRGLSICGMRCGGPLGGLDFPEYKGPMTAERMAQWCFMCAREASYGVRVLGTGRVFGVCQEHLEAVATLRSASKEDLEAWPKIELLGAFVSDPSKLVRPGKSLVEAIYEVEKYYADKEGREFP